MSVPPNKQMQPTGRTIPSSARALIAAGDQRNVEWRGRGRDRLQLICIPLGSANKDPSVPELRWYAAVLVLKGVAGPGWDDERLTERQLRLVRALNPDAAYERALSLGREAEHEYKNDAGEEVHWRFVGLAELAEIDEAELRDGSEVLSTYSAEDAELQTRPRDELAVFWSRANGDRSARDLLDEK